MEFEEVPTTQEALEQAMTWTEIAQEGFDPSTIDYAALDGVGRALEAVYVGYAQRQELLAMGIEPVDRTYRPFELVD